MNNPVMILYLEDNPRDAELVRNKLQQIGMACELRVVIDRAEYEAALAQTRFDLILSDYSLPDYDGMAALALARAKQPDVPFILISGTLGEEQAVDCVLRGATDFVLKQRINRLVPAVLRALTEAAEHQKRQEAETAEQASETRFSTVFHANPLSIAIARLKDGAFLDVNRAWEKAMGFTREEVIGRKGSELNIWIDAGQRDRLIRNIREHDAVQGGFDVQMRQKSGEVLDMFISAEQIDFAGESCILTMAMDITERKKAEEELKKSKALINAVVENVPLMIFLKEATDLRFVIFNRAGEELLGYDRKVLLGKNNLDLFPPEQAAHFMAKDREVLDGETGMLDIPEELILTAKKGQRLLHTRKICIRGDDGITKFLLGISEDITERKKAELEHETLEAQLRQSQKLDSIGQLAGGVAHDFNNMLAVINGYSQLILMELPESDPNYSRIQEINKAGERSADLTRQLLAFARKQLITPKILDLNDSITGIFMMLRRLIGENIELLWKPAANPWKVKMDPSQVDQILANLIVNTRDAINGPGKVVIEIGKADLDEVFCKVHPDSVPGKYVVLEVSDNGSGMDEETLAHIYEPFFTTKKIGEGTGLGLSTVFGIVKQNNGFINVYSELGKGTTFKIYLPRHESEDTERDENSKKQELFTGNETVMLVEDEMALLIFAKTLLEQLGYTVLDADSPVKAIMLAGEYKGEIHLLMTDVVMPEMSGRELKEKINIIRPGIKCLFMSGYTADIIVNKGVLDKGIHFLQKPFTAENMSIKLREALCVK